MKKEDFKKLALLGITGGLILSTTHMSAVYPPSRNTSPYNQPSSNQNTCGGHGQNGCGGNDGSNNDGSYRQGSWQSQGQRAPNQRGNTSWQQNQPSQGANQNWRNSQTAENLPSSIPSQGQGMTQQNQNAMPNRPQGMTTQPNQNMMQNRQQGVTTQPNQNGIQNRQQGVTIQPNQNGVQNRQMQTATPAQDPNMSEGSFYSQLDPEGKRVWNALDSEGRQLAMRLSKQFSNKNQAVREAQKHMGERLNQPSGTRGTFENRPSSSVPKTGTQTENRQYMFD